MRGNSKKVGELQISLRESAKTIEDLNRRVDEGSIALAEAEAAKAAAESAAQLLRLKLVEHPPSLAPTVVTQQSPDNAGAPANLDNICRNFVKGTCRFGAQCRFRHDVANVATDTAAHAAPTPISIGLESQSTVEPLIATTAVEVVAATDDDLAGSKPPPPSETLKRKAIETTEDAIIEGPAGNEPSKGSEEEKGKDEKMAAMRLKLLESKRLKTQKPPPASLNAQGSSGEEVKQPVVVNDGSMAVKEAPPARSEEASGLLPAATDEVLASAMPAAGISAEDKPITPVTLPGQLMEVDIAPSATANISKNLAVGGISAPKGLFASALGAAKTPALKSPFRAAAASTVKTPFSSEAVHETSVVEAVRDSQTDAAMLPTTTAPSESAAGAVVAVPTTTEANLVRLPYMIPILNL